MVLLGLLELFFALRLGLYLELILHSNLNVFIYLEDVESCAKGIPKRFGAQVKNPKRLNSSSKSVPKSAF